MEFFSKRNKVTSTNPNGLRSTSIELRERIWNVFYKEEYDYYDTVEYTSYTTGIEDMMLEMGIRYEFPANKIAKNENAEKLHKYVVQSGGIWYRIYDFIEKYLRLMEGDKLQQITKEFNRILEEEVAPYRILNGLVVPIIGESELAAIGETINSKYESVGIHMKKALRVDVELPQLTNENPYGCKKMGLESIDKTAIKVKCGKACTSDKCNFLCKWFVQKNYYLFLELASLQEYLESLPDNYFKPEIEVLVNSSDKNKLSSKQFTLLKKYVDGR